MQVRALLETRLVTLNGSTKDQCRLTGFHPIHAVVANGSTAM